MPRRPAAHGQRSLRALPAARTRSYRIRAKTGAEKRAGAGYDFAHAIIDDHSRLAYVELHDDELAETVTAFVTRALDWFSAHGIHAKRLMSDNAWSYTRNRSLRELLAAKDIKHLRTRPYRPQTNGKVCVLG
jgi:transposase InsO family protein